ncbi:cyclin-like protein [Thelephora terrestris]|uniref:Cyclin-like protein n=1 Tax=Thelephora terrestris TaxID=56493 RepID=A0A9P6H3C0_9AGAM|nr:cyclin-like protein [Thelephora terrestris]
MAESRIGIPVSTVKLHKPYFTPQQVQDLCEKTRGKLSISQEEKTRQHACTFIEAVGAKIGFPRKTIATAQSLYHRFHLFFPRKDFGTYDVCLAALYVSTKMHDTLKKPKDILTASYAVRFPEKALKSKTLVREVDVDPQALESDRQRLLAIERLILETICFNFLSKMAFPFVIKFGRYFNVSKLLTKFAWRLAVDAYRTHVPLMYPPHTVALGCLYLAALLTTFEQPPPPTSQTFQQEAMTPLQLISLLTQGGEWEEQFTIDANHLEQIAHEIIDLFVQVGQSPASGAPSANTSPSTPSSPPRHLSHSSQPHPQHLTTSLPFKSDQLMRLKIAMRDREAERPPRASLTAFVPGHNRTGLSSNYHNNNNNNWGYGQGNGQPGEGPGGEPAISEGLGRNEGTVRFLFGADWD